MKINQNKSKTMIFNFTKKYQFTTRLSIQNTKLEVIKQTKLLGVIITDDLKWDSNTEFLMKKKANARMELLRKIKKLQCFSRRSSDSLQNVYKKYFRAVLPCLA